MKRFIIICYTLMLIPLMVLTQTPYTLVIHGGAGNISQDNIDENQQALYHAKLTEALLVGEKVLQRGGTAMDAVVAAVTVMEDSPLFNSGVGAVFNAEGKHELDASVMDGKTKLAGAVAGVTIIKNPVLAARLVMDSSAHVMLSGKGADQFAQMHSLEVVDNTYFDTEKSYKEYQRVKQKQETEIRKGTVGAVALDKQGNLAAATSTGGMTFKKYGRIGDSPVIGAGTYADNESCAVSCTGHGEYFIRNVVAYDVSARMLYLKETLDDASNFLINVKLKEQGATGGLVAVDNQGNIAMPFNTSGMFRGFIKEGSNPVVLMFR